MASLKLDEWTLSPYVGVNYHQNWQFNTGLRYRYLADCPGCPPVGAEFKLSTDINGASNYKFNLRFESSAYYILMFGLTTQYWNTDNGSLFTLGPKVGFNIYIAELSYSYNFHLAKQFNSIGKNRLSLTFDLETIYDLIEN